MKFLKNLHDFAASKIEIKFANRVLWQRRSEMERIRAIGDDDDDVSDCELVRKLPKKAMLEADSTRFELLAGQLTTANLRQIGPDATADCATQSCPHSESVRSRIAAISLSERGRRGARPRTPGPG